MILIKVINYALAWMKMCFFKVIYGKSIRFGRGTTFRRHLSVMIGKKGKVLIGEKCFFNNNCSLNALNEIVIGNNSVFGEGVKVYDHNHRFDQADTPIKKQGYSIGTVRIGSNCWIASNVVILKNTEIGNHCVIGAGCVVSGRIEDETILKPNQNAIRDTIHLK